VANLWAGLGSGNCAGAHPNKRLDHINVHCNMMAIFDIIARLDRSHQQSELVV
jgi:hypothetical protein